MSQPPVDELLPPAPNAGPDMLRLLGIALVPIAFLTSGLAL